MGKTLCMLDTNAKFWQERRYFINGDTEEPGGGLCHPHGLAPSCRFFISIFACPWGHLWALADMEE